MQQQLAEFLENLLAEKGLSLNTISAYEIDIKQFILASKISKPHQITQSVILQFINLLAEKHFAPKTQARKLSAIKEFCKYLYSTQQLQENPAQNIDSPKQEKLLPKFLTETEIKLLIQQSQQDNSLKNIKLHAMLILAYHCGLRVSELISLKTNSINYDKKQITVLGKGSKQRIVPVSKTAINTILKYTEALRLDSKYHNTTWLFPSSQHPKTHLTRDTFFKQLKQLAIKTGINPRRVSPHILRHSFATQLLRHDANLRSVQKMLGHESISTTEIYTHIISDELIEKIQRLHPLGKK